MSNYHYLSFMAKNPKQINLKCQNIRESLSSISFTGNNCSGLMCANFGSARCSHRTGQKSHYLYKCVLQWNNFPLCLPQKSTARISFITFPVICLYLHGYSERSQATMTSTEINFTLSEQKFPPGPSPTELPWCDTRSWQLLWGCCTAQTLTLPQMSFIATCTKMEASSMPSRYTCL